MRQRGRAVDALPVEALRRGGLRHSLRHGVVVILLLAAEHLDVAASHRAAVLLQGEVHLHGVGEEDVGLAGGAAVAADDEHVDGIQALEKLEDVELDGVEGEAAKANDGESLLHDEAAAGAGTEAGAHAADHAGAETHRVHHRGGIHPVARSRTPARIGRDGRRAEGQRRGA